MNNARSNGAAASFEALIQADRKKKKNQELAEKLLGGGRRASAPGATSNRKAGGPGSLASRVGVHKKNSPAPKSNINGQWTHDLHKAQGLSRTTSSSRLDRGLSDAIERDTAVNGSNSQFNIRSASGPQLSIRGKANPGPYCVIASNFANGTTPDDIRLAFESHVDDMLSCVIVTDRPQLIAEAVFTKRESAQNIVNVFNNSMADGHLLYVYIKPGPPSPVHNLEGDRKVARTSPPASSSSQKDDTVRDQSKLEDTQPPPPAKDDVMMDVDTSSRSRRDEPARDDGRLSRDGYDRGPPRYHSNGYEDGRYGFTDAYDRRPRQDYRPAYTARPRYDDRAWRSGPRWR
ncbi:MAG: hypothetical protein Q9162_006755 [Coniocarpon cinnabarinum]